MFFKKEQKMQIMSFSRLKKSRNVVSSMPDFIGTWLDEKFSFRNLSRCKICNSKSDALYFFSFQSLTHCSFPFQSLTWRKKFYSNFGAMRSFWFEIWIFKWFSGSCLKMANRKEEYEEFATCRCMIIGEVCWYVGIL